MWAVWVIIGALAAVGPAATDSGAPAGAATYVATAPSGEMVINGTSTLHDWNIKTAAMEGSAVLSLPAAGGTAAKPAIESIHMVIGVNSLRGSDGAGMDGTIHDSLQGSQNPIISYDMTSAKLQSSPAGPGKAWQFATVGNLSVAGNWHPIHMALDITPGANGAIVISAEVKMKMTDCGVQPPTAFLGAIRSRDDMTIDVTWNLKQTSAQK